MRITIVELEREPLEYDVTFPPGAVDFAEEATQLGDLTSKGLAEVLHEHRGPKEIVTDIRLRGDYHGRLEVPCARCIEPVETPVHGDFDLIFRPVGVDSTGNEQSISTDETEIGYYLDGGLTLEDVLREQVLLSLPARTLCKPDCKGLCPICGVNRNEVSCECHAEVKNPQWSALANLRDQISTEK